jgi:hypothetical protein
MRRLNRQSFPEGGFIANDLEKNETWFGIARPMGPVYGRSMSSATQELVEIVNGLPEDRVREVVDFARFLQQQSGDREWERIIAEKRTYQKLENFAVESLREGRGEPLDSPKL